jgi:NADH dehydrogenase FAD-containing subunit
MPILVLGAGFGGLELTTRLADELGDAVDIVLIDKADGFVFGFSKLDVMFGRTTRRRSAIRTATWSSRVSGSSRPRSGPSTRFGAGCRPTPAHSGPT